MTIDKDRLITVNGLKKYFSTNKVLGNSKSKFVKAVDDVSFYIKKGETLGLVGESGCGKSTLGRTITRLYDVTEGQILYRDTDIAVLDKRGLAPYRKLMQVVFQDPYSAFNPHMNISEIIGEPIELHKRMGKKEQREYMIELLHRVGLKEEDLDKFPHEFSGGQRQRIGIARALSVEPEFILCDEPISALDVSIQAQVVNMFQDLQQEMNLTYLFVAHDLSMVRHISDRIGVMYLGKLVEIGESTELYKKPLHPYTMGLLASIPKADPIKAREESSILIEGDAPNPFELTSGCRFCNRCPYANEKCRQTEPEMKKLVGEHYIACHLY